MNETVAYRLEQRLGRRLLEPESQWFGDPCFQLAARRINIEPHSAAQEVLGVEPAEGDVGVDYRRLCSARPVGATGNKYRPCCAH